MPRHSRDSYMYEYTQDSIDEDCTPPCKWNTTLEIFNDRRFMQLGQPEYVTFTMVTKGADGEFWKSEVVQVPVKEARIIRDCLNEVL